MDRDYEVDGCECRKENSPVKLKRPSHRRKKMVIVSEPESICSEKDEDSDNSTTMPKSTSRREENLDVTETGNIAEDEETPDNDKEIELNESGIKASSAYAEVKQKTMWDFLKPQHFNDVILAALKCSFLNADDVEDLVAPSDSIKLKYDILRLVNGKWAMVVKQTGNESHQEAQDSQTRLLLYNKRRTGELEVIK
ncbi:uncharacterized protein LOC110462108 [Mizuhopecten yessoensis]|uniref:uncharacterized protein LOC110462108 n=1 Tax=Mizuhopecten yessoensis TaxID=6573 RepID=UPI000B45E1C5|nr:uncharacterized protein LOC110462108 [Mizuhopecten yessoensis]